MAKIPMADKEFKKDDEDFKEEVMGHKRDLALDYKSELHEYEAKTSQGKTIISQVDFKKKLLKHQIVDSAEIDIEININKNYGQLIACRLHLYIEEELYFSAGNRANKKKLAEEIKKDLIEIKLSNDRYIADVYIRSSQKEHSLIEQINISIGEEDKKRLWENHEYIKLFISHRHEQKKEVMALKKELQKYGISSFVAHVDIKPTKEWMIEIEKALHSMDVFLAYLTENFSEGEWADQEAGFALAKGSKIIPMQLRKEDPHGFIGKFQALQGEAGKSKEMAIYVLNAIWDELSDRKILKKSGLLAFKNSPSHEHANKLFDKLKTIEDFSENELEKIVVAYNDNRQIHNNPRMKNEFLNFLNKVGGDNYERPELIIIPKKNIYT